MRHHQKSRHTSSPDRETCTNRRMCWRREVLSPPKASSAEPLACLRRFLFLPWIDFFYLDLLAAYTVANCLGALRTFSTEGDLFHHARRLAYNRYLGGLGDRVFLIAPINIRHVVWIGDVPANHFCVLFVQIDLRLDWPFGYKTPNARSAGLEYPLAHVHLFFREAQHLLFVSTRCGSRGRDQRLCFNGNVHPYLRCVLMDVHRIVHIKDRHDFGNVLLRGADSEDRAAPS